MSNLIEHAKRELKIAGYDLEDREEGPNKWMVENILELITVFSKQGHSGFSAGYCRSMFNILANFEPIAPLTGEDSEWNEVGEGVFQNNRSSNVFKENGKAYKIDGKVFREPDGSCYTNKKSHVPVVFPYTPKIEYVDIPYEDNQETL